MPSSNSFGLSIHGDVLGASPVTLDQKQSLVAEIKRRCKGIVTSKRYTDAGTLYTKAIEVSTGEEEMKKELAILYSNRSLTRCMTNQNDLAVEDALAAIDNNPMYEKGFWRLGVAYAACQKYSDAIDAYERGLKVLPEGISDKTWHKEIAKCREKASNGTSSSASTTSYKPSSKKTTTTTKTSSSKNKPNHVVDNDADEKIFTSSDAVRGYKVVQGKKTSYFHHEQTEEEKLLIGNIAPKRLTVTSPTPIEKNTSNQASAWNKAGTWEDKDCTSSAKELLSNMLLLAKFDLPQGGVAKVTKITDFDGYANIVTVRSKLKHVYEFSFTVEWNILQNGLECIGSMKYPEVDGTCNDEDDMYEITDFRIKEKDDADLELLAHKFIRKDGLRCEIHKRILEWFQVWLSSPK